jgi:hypothetical protein
LCCWEIRRKTDKASNNKDGDGEKDCWSGNFRLAKNDEGIGSGNMEPVTGTGAVIIAGAVVVVGIAAYLTFKHYCRMTVAAASSPVSVTLYGTVAVTATLQRKSWLFGSWTPVTPATITATPTGTANATVAGSPTSAAAPGATVSIIGATVGSTTIKISGTGGDCTSISADIPVAVV